MRCVIIILFACCLLSCRRNPPYGANEIEVMDTVRITLNQYFTDVCNKGMMAELDYLDASKDFFWVPPGYTAAISYDSVVAAIKTNATRFVKVDNRWDTLRVIPLSFTHATYTGRITSTMTDSAGKTYQNVLIETGNVVKRDNGWKLLNGQTAFLK